MAVATKIRSFMERASWIRKMFEEGAALKKKFGAENVYDFTLGNPDVPAPAEVDRILGEILKEDVPLKHGYIPNAGFPETRAAIAARLTREQGIETPPEAVVMTCGAGGALNVVFKTILNPGDEVISPRPYFVEYNFYVDNHGGILKTVPSRPDFTLDLEKIAEAVTEKTKAVLINSPNNPTGVVFPAEQIKALGELLSEKSEAVGHTIYLVSDEPYRHIVYDGVSVPPIFPYYRNSIVADSYSKSLSLAGERIGYLALHPEAEDFSETMNGLIFSNRVLGFVNAPALMQRLVGRIQGLTVDVGRYKAKRDLLYEGLRKAGFDAARPAGAFYLFPKSPMEDDVEFVRELQKFKILAVPGSGFGGPGYFRLAYCVSDETIRKALPVFEEAGRRADHQFHVVVSAVHGYTSPWLRAGACGSPSGNSSR